MELTSLEIKNFRGARNVTIPHVGNFNVLIGKNNSGKSTILGAIKAFFQCLRRGEVVALTPPIGRDAIDFSHRSTNSPIEIVATFAIQKAEQEALVKDIATEAPQLRNAVEAIDPSMWVQVSLKISAPAERFAYVDRVALVPRGGTNGQSITERVLFAVQPPAAHELAERQRELRKLNSVSDDLTRAIRIIDDDDYNAIRRGPEETHLGRINYIVRRALGEPSSETVSTLEAMVRQSTSLADLQSNVKAFVGRSTERANAILASPLKSQLVTFSGQQSTVPGYVLNLLKLVGSLRVLYLTEHRKQVGREEAERLLQLKVERGGDEILSSIKQRVGSLLGVKIDAFAAPGQPSGRSAEMDVDNFLLEVNGSGIREALRLILDVEFQKPQLLLVEEPEVHLHPALETNLMSFLKRLSTECQVIISTHSTNFLDTADMRNVYLVSKLDKDTEVQMLDLESAEAKLPKELGIRLSSLFMFDRLVFVEGPSDEALLREWANVLSVNLSQVNVGFIGMGGVRNFGHYAAETVFSFLSKRQIASWFILDRDERDQTEIARLQERLGAKARVEILECREIENFLLVPRPLAEFIRLKLDLASSKTNLDLSENGVKAAMEQCADELKQIAIDKRLIKYLCAPIYSNVKSEDVEGKVGIVVGRIAKQLAEIRNHLDEAIKNIDAYVKEVATAVDVEWRQEKFRVVPGDILLDRVCKRYGVRFKKNIDGPRLAALMKDHEIDLQVKKIIRELVTPY